MDEAMLSAVSGIDANQTWLDVISNNISNANTTGFKQDNIDFDDLLSQQIAGATAPNGVGLGGANGVAVGTGTKVAAITPDESEGTLEQTSDPTDVFISGNGYIIANNGGTAAAPNLVYTRDGTLLFDSDGNLVTPDGALVQGWEAGNGGVTGQINNSLPLTKVTIPSGLAIAPNGTSNVNMGGNLPADAAIGTTETATVQVYDQQGNPETMTLDFTVPSVTVTAGVNDTITFMVNGVAYNAVLAPGTYSSDSTLASAIQTAMNGAGSPATFGVTSSGGTFTINDTSTIPADNTFEVTAGDGLATLGMNVMTAYAASTTAVPSPNVWNFTGSIANDGGFTFNGGQLVFNGSGVLQSVNGVLPGSNGAIQYKVTPTTPDGAGGTFNAFEINFPATAVGSNNVTQYAGNNSLEVLSQDGYATGSLASLSIGQTGIITGAFTNGQSLQLGQIALATFANPTGLAQVGDNYWQATANSGIPLVSQPGSGGAGTITGGALESSNVDMATQLTNMVIAQNSFQANTRVVTTEATDLTSLIQMG